MIISECGAQTPAPLTIGPAKIDSGARRCTIAGSDESWLSATRVEEELFTA